MNRFILLLILLLQVVLPVTVALLHSVTLRNIYRQSPETTSQKERNKRMMSPETVLKVRRLDSSVSTKATVSNSDSSFTSTASDDEASDFDTKSLQRTLDIDFISQLKMNRRPWIVGHRGCLYDELENTREGFQKSNEMGADAVELDVFLLKCGSLIVFHGGGTDENPGHLLDYCNVDKGILDLTYEEALELTFNPNYAEFGCTSEKILAGCIPTLEQVLVDAKKSGLHVKVELKGPGTVEPTLELVEQLDMTSQVSYSSFDHDRIAHLRKLRPDKSMYPTGALFNDLPHDFLDQAERAGATEIHLRYDTCHQNIISRIHDAGYGSMAWFRGPIGMASDCQDRFWDVGNEDESMYEAMLRTGVQQMCINRPDVLVQVRQKLLTTADDVEDNINDVAFYKDQWQLHTITSTTHNVTYSA